MFQQYIMDSPPILENFILSLIALVTWIFETFYRVEYREHYYRLKRGIKAMGNYIFSTQSGSVKTSQVRERKRIEEARKRYIDERFAEFGDVNVDDTSSKDEVDGGVPNGKGMSA